MKNKKKAIIDRIVIYQGTFVMVIMYVVNHTVYRLQTILEIPKATL